MPELNQVLDHIFSFFSKPGARGWLLVVSISLILSLIGTTLVTSKLNADEHTACQIQAHGLPIGHTVNRIFDDIHTLILIPQTPATKAVEQRLMTPSQYARQQAAIGTLNSDLTQLDKLERMQPQTRKCPF